MRGKKEEPDLRIVSNTLKACCSSSGRVCVGPVQTLVWASNTVWLGLDNAELRYEEESDGFRTSNSGIPNCSTVAESNTALNEDDSLLRPIQRRRSSARNLGNGWDWKRVEFRDLLGENEFAGERIGSGFSRAFMALRVFVVSASVSRSLCLRGYWFFLLWVYSANSANNEKRWCRRTQKNSTLSEKSE